jgi:hypothetical protein
LTAPRSATTLGWLAAKFDITGGAIRNVALASAFRAASSGGVVTMDDVTASLRRELQKLGRLITEGELCPPAPR